MEIIHAISLAPSVNTWLENSHHPQILHVFDQGCNLINERREVLSIVTLQIGNGPFNVVVEDNVLFPEHLNVESKISIRTNQLQLGNLIINTAGAKLWSARPDWEGLHAIREGVISQLQSLPITKYPPLLPYTLISNLTSALVNADIPAAITVTSQLAGLGAGLTPAGDDYIMGAIYAAWIIHPPELASVLAEDVANTAGPLTTSLSATWLRSARRGEAGILWHQFFEALMTADPNQIQEAVVRILAVGETSGADALAGFLNPCALWASEVRRQNG